jgi:hypothetical protein
MSNGKRIELTITSHLLQNEYDWHRFKLLLVIDLCRCMLWQFNEWTFELVRRLRKSSQVPKSCTSSYSSLHTARLIKFCFSYLIIFVLVEPLAQYSWNPGCFRSSSWPFYRVLWSLWPAWILQACVLKLQRNRNKDKKTLTRKPRIIQKKLHTCGPSLLWS